MREPEPPDLSIILVNWNQLGLTSEALESIRTHVQGISYEVFVVDNGSTRDESRTAIPARFPWVRFVQNPDNRGFSKANNRAVRLAQGRYVLLLNNDTVQIENALGEAVRYMDARPELGALGILHLNRDEARSVQASFFSFPDPWPEIRSLCGLGGAKPSPPPDYTCEQDPDWIVGSFLMMRRECYADVGELDERFFIYDEDVDWCLRARRAGYGIRFWPGAKMIHVGASANPFMKDKTLVHFRSHLSYIYKNHSALAAGCYYLAMAGRLTLATIKSALGMCVGRSNWTAFQQRVFRQRQFLLLRSGRTGG